MIRILVVVLTTNSYYHHHSWNVRSITVIVVGELLASAIHCAFFCVQLRHCKSYIVIANRVVRIENGTFFPAKTSKEIIPCMFIMCVLYSTCCLKINLTYKMCVRVCVIIVSLLDSIIDTKSGLSRSMAALVSFFCCVAYEYNQKWLFCRLDFIALFGIINKIHKGDLRPGARWLTNR